MFGLKKKPELSVVIPVLNTRKYLAECLDSVRIATQDLDAEILIVDNGSTDGSIEFIQKYIGKHRKFRLLHQGTPGPGAARNRGVEAARGKYLAFVDSDDFVAPDIYERMLHVAREDDCDMVVCNVIRKQGNKFIHSELHRKAFHNLRDRKIDVDTDTDLAFDCTVWNRIILTELYKKNNICFPDVHYCEDFPVVQQLYCLAKNVRFVQKWGYCWRYRSDSITCNITRKHLEEEIAMLRYLKENALKYGASDKYLDAINYKSLALEFASCIATLRERDTETGREFVELISSYIEEDVDLAGVRDLSLYNQQKIKYLLDKDLESLIILSNYLKINYLNAPVVYGEDGYEMVLPDSIFDIGSRSFKNEFNNSPFWLSIDTVDVDESSMSIHTHVYVRRIDMPDFSYQNVRAFLINDLSGAELELKVEKEMRPSLTKARGEVLNHDDYRLYHYNYDGTGIAFKIDIDEFADKKEFFGWNFILLECDNAVGHKNLVLRFGTKKSLQAINNTELKSKNASVKFSTDEIEIFGITVDPASEAHQRKHP